MNATKHKAWLWPHHNIGKVESRRLREEHNLLYNSHAELIEILRGILQHIDRGEVVVRDFIPSAIFPGSLGPSKVNEQATKYMAEELKAAIAKAKGNQ